MTAFYTLRLNLWIPDDYAKVIPSVMDDCYSLRFYKEFIGTSSVMSMEN